MMEFVETSKIEIAAIENINGSWFGNDLVEKIDFVNLAMRNENQSGNGASQIHERMQLDGPLALSKFGPRENGEAQIDRGRVEGIYGLLQFYPEIVVRIKLSRLSNKDLGEIGIDAPVSNLIGMS